MEAPFRAWLATLPPSHPAVEARPVTNAEVGRGWGVFATTDLPRKTFAGYYTGAYVHHSTLATTCDRTHALSVGLDLEHIGYVIDGRIAAAVARVDAPLMRSHLGAVINSSEASEEKPNVEVRRDGRARALVGDGFAATPVYTTRAVRAGEQLLHNYVVHDRD